MGEPRCILRRMSGLRDIHKAMVEGSLRYQAGIDQDRDAQAREAAKGGFVIALVGIGALIAVAVAAIALMASVASFFGRLA